MAEAEKPKKRRIRPSPTVRQQAERAQTQAGKPSRKQSGQGRRFVAKLSKPFGPLKKLSKFTPVRWFLKFLKLLGKILWPPYLRQSWRELKLVTWPSWKDSRRLTYAVIIFSVVFGALISGVDFGLTKVFRHLLIGK